MNKSVGENFLRARALVLIGMPGAGKSSVGRALARLRTLPFHDADREIESASGCSIAQLFAACGEDEFRRRERQVIARLLQIGPGVLSLGGGAFMDADTRAAIAAQAFSIWLRVEPALLAQRIARNQNRPLFRGVDVGAKLADLIATREPVYRTADLIVDCDDRPVAQTARRVNDALQAAPAFQIR